MKTIEEVFPIQIEELKNIETQVLTGYTLADAIREGASVTKQATGLFGNSQGQACALTAASIAAKARGYTK